MHVQKQHVRTNSYNRLVTVAVAAGSLVSLVIYIVDTWQWLILSDVWLLLGDHRQYHRATWMVLVLQPTRGRRAGLRNHNDQCNCDRQRPVQFRRCCRQSVDHVGCYVPWPQTEHSARRCTCDHRRRATRRGGESSVCLDLVLLSRLLILVSMFQAGRFVSGLAIGILVTICPMYMAELAPPAKRGWLVGHHAIFLVFGYMLSGWLGYACYFATDSNPSFAWRFPLCVQCLSPLILAVCSFFIPESPRFLLQKGRAEEAFATVKRLRKTKEDPDDLAAREEVYQTKAQIALDEAKLRKLNVSPWGAVMKIRSYRKRMIIGFLTQWGAEFAGPLVIVSDCRCASSRYMEAMPV